MSEETWKPVWRHEPDYEVSSMGRVRRIQTGHVLKPHVYKPGYPYVQLWRSNRCYTRPIHRLVAEAFLSVHLRSGMHVNHKNGDKLDARVANLEVVTPSENERHKRHVLRTCGSFKRRKLTFADAEEIRALKAAGATYSELFKRFGVAQGTIQRIVERTIYTY